MGDRAGKIVLMGSGELSATMVEVYKDLLRDLPEPRRAVFIDTPAGFQLNADEISARAAGYFERHVGHPLAVASFKDRAETSPLAAEQAFRRLRAADLVLIGPGSPSYALRQLQATPIPDILRRRVAAGGCLVAASAAALTLGRFTLPVYEIYKVGAPLHWLDGLDLLGRFGLDLAVVPHWNNAEGGTHDTRCCFMGRSRYERLEALLPPDLPVLGIDEHTALVLDLAAGTGRVRGLGEITIRRGGIEAIFTGAAPFPLEALIGSDPAGGSGGVSSFDRTRAETAPAWAAAPKVRAASLADRVAALERSVHDRLAERDFRAATNAVLELDRLIWQAQNDPENADAVVQARDSLRECLVELGTALSSGEHERGTEPAALVKDLLELRERWRQSGKFAEADALRELLGRFGVLVADAPIGVSRHRAV